MNQETNLLNKKKVLSIIIEKADSIVAASGLFANVGVFGITLKNMNNAPGTEINLLGTFGMSLYIGLIVFAVIIAYGLWNFKAWGWLITVLFSVACILLVVPDILNYHAALVSMILLSYITQPDIRNKYTN